MGTSSCEALAVLEVLDKTYYFTLGKYLAGRDESCDIFINHPTVEKRHAVIVVQSHGVKIADLFTDTGTYIDDENICNGKFNDILKSGHIKFGCVDAQLRIIEEQSDSGFLGFLSKDASDIIPMSPQGCSTVRQNSQIGRSRIRSTKSNFQDEFRIPEAPAGNVPSDDKPDCKDFFANVTDVNIRKNIEEMAEEDDYYVPETQEIFEKRPQSSGLEDTNEGMFRISTQEFEEDSKISSMSNLLDMPSLIVPKICHSPVLIPEIKEGSPSVIKSRQKNNSESPSVADDIKPGNETESEMSMLNWNESRNTSVAQDLELDEMKIEERNRDGSVTPDLELIKAEERNKDGSVNPDFELNDAEEKNKEGSVTPDLELVSVRSGSATPDLFKENEHVSDVSTKIDIEDHLLSPTQVFQPKKTMNTKSNTSCNQVQAPLNVSSKNSDADTFDLDVTQPFVVIQKGNNRRNIKSSHLLKNTDAVFARPLPKAPLTIDPDLEEYDAADATQLFPLKDRFRPSTSVREDVDDFDQFTPTQNFEFKKETKQKNRSISPDLILSSDEDMNNEEFCLRETLQIDNLETSAACQNSSEGSTRKKGKRKTELEKAPHRMTEDSLFSDIQPTPRMDSIKLPNESAIDNVAKLFFKQSNNRRHRVSLLDDSSEEDENDNVFEKPFGKGVVWKNNVEVTDTKKMVVRLKRDRKSDEALKQLKLGLDTSSDVQSKVMLSDQSAPSDVQRRQRGRPKRRKNSDDTTNKRSSTIDNFDKSTENINKCEKTKDDKKKLEIIPQEKKDKLKTTTSKKESQRTRSQKPTLKSKKTSKLDDVTSDHGESERYLRPRTSKRLKSAPSYITDEYVTEDYFQRKRKAHVTQKVDKSEDLSKTLRKETGAITSKQYPKGSENPEKKNSIASVDARESNKNSNTKSPKVPNTDAEKEFSTSTPNIRKSSRKVKHRICFTRVDSSPYRGIIQKTGCTIEDNPQSSTVLVAAKITRTWKLLAAIAKGLPIVSLDWFNLFESNYNKSYSYDDHLLKDPSAERQYKFNLKNSLQVARKRPIFKNFTFLITPHTQPNTEEMTSIIKSGGGNVIVKCPRDAEGLRDFYIISSREDESLWEQLKKATNASIYSTEAVMSAVMQQCINFKHYQLS